MTARPNFCFRRSHFPKSRAYPAIFSLTLLAAALPALAGPAFAQLRIAGSDGQTASAHEIFNAEASTECAKTNVCEGLLPRLPAGATVTLRQVGCTIFASKGAQFQYVDIAAAAGLQARAKVHEFLGAPVLTGEDADTSYYVLHSGTLLPVTAPDRIRVGVVWVAASAPAFTVWTCSVSGQIAAQ
jgi:hypothetical protein